MLYSQYNNKQLKSGYYIMRGMLDAIYWRLHTSYLKNYRQEAERFMGFLEEEIGGHEEALEREVGFIHAERFRKIRDRMKIGCYGRLYGIGDGVDDFAFSFSSKKKSGDEREFCKTLAKDRGKFLLSNLNIEFWADIVDEYNMDPYGRCDFAVFEGRSMHIIEVKMGEAPSSVVSQIDKYILAAELDMCLNLYDEVSAYVLAESFPPYVAGELSRLQVTMVEHRGQPNTLKRLEKK